MKKRTLLNVFAMSALGVIALTSCGQEPLSPYRIVDMDADVNGTTVEWWTGFGEDIKTIIADDIVPDIQEQLGITLDHQSKGGYDNLQKAVNLGAGRRKYPNLAVGYPDHFASYIASNMQLRLDPYFEHEPELLNDYYPSYLKENQELEFDPEDGHGYTVGVPFNKSTEVLVYNEDFFNSQVAIDWGVTKVPETWDEVKTIGENVYNHVKLHFGKYLATNGQSYDKETDIPTGSKMLMNLTSATADNWYFLGYDSTSNLFITALRQWAGQYTEIDRETGLGYAVYNNATTISMLEFMRDLAQKHVLAIPASFGGTSLYCSDYYKTYNCLMNVGSSAGLGHYTAGTLKSKSAVTSVPYKDAEHKFVISQGTNLCMLNKGTDVEILASWKTLKYLTTGEVNGLFCARTGYYPATKSAYNSTVYQKFLTDAPSDENDGNKKKAARVNSEIYDADDSGWTKFVDPGFNGSSLVRTEVGSLISTVLLTNKDIQECLDDSYNTIANYVRS